MKPKPIEARACIFSRAFCRLRVITSSFDWFTGLSPSFLIGFDLVLVLRHSIESRSVGNDWLDISALERLSYDLVKVFAICFTDQCLAR